MSLSTSAAPSEVDRQKASGRDGSDKAAKKRDVQAKLEVKFRAAKKLPPLPSTPLGQPAVPMFASYDAAVQKLAAIKAEQVPVQEELLAAAGPTTAVSDFRAMPAAERYKQATAFATALGKVDALYAKYPDLDMYAQSGLNGAKTLEGGGGVPVPAVAKWIELQASIVVQRNQLRENGLPDGYKVTASAWAAGLIDELKPFTQGASADENDKLRKASARSAPTDVDKAAAEAAGTRLKQAELKYLVRGADRSSVFFDAGRSGVAMSLDDQNTVHAANTELAKLGSGILNNGGTYKQVQALMRKSGLGEEQWPPELVQAVQAWRKTQRALNAERVQVLLSKQPADIKLDGETVASTTETIATLSQLVAAGGELSQALAEIQKLAEEARKKAEEAAKSATDTVSAAGHTAKSTDTKPATDTAAASSTAITAAAWVNGIGSGVDGIAGMVQMVQAAIEFYTVLTDDEMPGRKKFLALLGVSLDALGAAARTGKDAMQMAKDFGGTAVHDLMARVVPGLNIAVASIELAKSSKKLAESMDGLNKAGAVKRDALASFAGDDGDEAAVNVFSNDKRAAKTKVAKSGVETGANAIELSGAIATTAGGAHGAAAGAALSISAGAIKLGSKVIFAGIDWSAAQKAKKTLEEAKAGNYQAQVEVFDDSNYYAKMYLAIMVKEKNPQAAKYLVNQGIEEGDLDGATSLGILRDHLMESAEQSNDLDVDDTMISKIVGAGGKAVDKLRDMSGEDWLKAGATFVLAGGVLAPITLSLLDFAEKGLSPSYDPTASYDIGAFPYPGVATWPAAWEAARDEHRANGMLKGDDGLDAALTRAAAADKAAAPPARSPTDRAAMLALRKPLQEAIEATMDVIARSYSAKFQAYQPGLLPKKTPHVQAYKSMALLRTGATLAQADYQKRFDELWPGLDKDDAGIEQRVGYKKGDEKLPDAGWKALSIKSIDAVAWAAFWADGRKHVGFPDSDGGVAEAIAASLAAKGKYEGATDNKQKRKFAQEYMSELDDVNDAALTAQGIREVNQRPTAKAAVDEFMLLLNAARRGLDDVLADRQQAVWKSPARDFDKIPISDYAAEWKKVWSYASDEGFAAGSDDGRLGEALKSFAADYASLQSAGADAPTRLKAIRSMEVQAGRVKKLSIAFGRKQRYAAEALKAYAELVRLEVSRVTKDHVDIDNIRAEQVDFLHTPTKAPLYLDRFDWRRVVTDAVAQGAVLESKTAADKLFDALAKQKSERKAYASEDTKTAKSDKRGKHMRKAASSYEKSLHATVAAVAMTRGLKRYGQNQKMAKYLDGVEKATEAELDEPKLKGFLEGTACAPADLKLLPAKLDVGDWSTKKKDAQKYGVIPDGDTGMHKAIEEFVKATDPAVRKEKRKALNDLLIDVRATSKNPQWLAYIDGLVADLKASV